MILLELRVEYLNTVYGNWVLRRAIGDCFIVFVRLFAVTGLILFKFGISCFCKHLWTQPNFGQNIVDF